MTRNQISYCIFLAILLAAPLPNAALDQAALLRLFMESQARSEADRITALPGQPPRVNFEQYAGYVTVDEEHGRALFYYFVESPYDAASKPLVLWLNGGPGCSSLGIGAMTELGPFRVNPDGKTLSRNRHAWNNVANVIFLESPAGVGFSYSNTSSDYDKRGDERTAVDSYVFLLHWLERFPEYKGRDFYIAGESYAGHYVPELAAVIVAVRKHTGKDPTNLKGIFVGNPLLDFLKNFKGGLEFLWNHGVMSDEAWANIAEHCSFGPSDGVLCDEAESPFNHFNFFTTVGNIDTFNIYAPICIQAPNGTTYPSGYLPGYDPCTKYYVTNYFNSLDVQEAIHARINTTWSNCTKLPHWNFNEAPILTMVPTISWLVDNGLRVWLYSGDMDDVCPITATRYSVQDLNLTITKPWRPWYAPANEVGGYIQQHEGGFTFASVRGAGHMVPSFQPKRSLVLFHSFLKGVLPPAVSLLQP
ncbi:serine carboxypeptidase 2 [Setaria italica]|uniref:serine carboxypeptidase 2 n=1 Tax=Setaria italica TaxID=4555 RepID=UPI000BE604E1|nr:serine carboxypeptidase 2 [Setaria italica]